MRRAIDEDTVLDNAVTDGVTDIVIPLVYIMDEELNALVYSPVVSAWVAEDDVEVKGAPVLPDSDEWTAGPGPSCIDNGLLLLVEVLAGGCISVLDEASYPVNEALVYASQAVSSYYSGWFAMSSIPSLLLELWLEGMVLDKPVS